MLPKILVFSVSEMLGNSITYISAKMKWNLGIRIKPLCSNHSIGEFVSIRRRVVFESSHRVRR